MMLLQADLPLDGASGGLADHLESKISDSQSRQVEQVHERLTCHVNDFQLPTTCAVSKSMNDLLVL